MKKKVFSFISFAAIAAVAGWNYNQNMNNVNLSDVALENVEALASGEGGRFDICHTNIDYTAICNIYDNGNICPCGF